MTDKTTMTVPVEWAPEVRETATGSRITGYAAVWNSRSADLGGFTETLRRGCMTDALSRSDLWLLWAHDSDAVLARQSAGTLHVTEDARGLKVEADIVNTTLGRDVLELVRTGHVSSMSFAFTVAPNGDRWTQRDGESHREITKVGQLFEVSIVPTPAYDATSVEASRAAGERVLAEVRSRRSRTRVMSEPDPYTGRADAPSYFRDLFVLEAARERKRRAIEDPILRGRDPGAPTQRGMPKPEEAEARLRGIGRRDLVSGSVGSAMSPQNMPAAVADEFALASRDRGVLTSVLRTLPMPELGMTVPIPVLTSGASAGVQNPQNTALSETDPVFDLEQGEIATVGGTLKGSQQFLDLGVNSDLHIARELGAAHGEAVDRQLLDGTGSNGETLGIAAVSGITSNAVPVTTLDGIWKGVGKTYGEVAEALGVAPDLMLVHPRRDIAMKWGAMTADRPAQMPADLRVVQVPAISTVKGASTNEDEILLVRRDEIPVWLGPVTTRFVFDGAITGTLQWRLVTYQYVASGAIRKPHAIGQVTGLTPFSWA